MLKYNFSQSGNFYVQVSKSGHEQEEKSLNNHGKKADPAHIM